MFRASKEIHDRLTYHSNRLGATISALIREATVNHLELLDQKEEAYKLAKQKRKTTLLPELVGEKPQGLGPVRAPSAKKVEGPPPPPPSPFAALAPPPYVVPDKVKRAFRNWAEYLEEADGIVDTERRAKKIVDDLKERVEEKDVQPCYEAFVDFCETRKAMKEKPMVTVGDVPIVGDV